MYLIFDTETTGLPQNFNAPLTDSDNWPRMVQISWQFHDENGNLVENKDYIIKPENYDIPFKSTMIHGITTEMAHEQGHDLEKILKEFYEVLERTKVVVGHNIQFDYNIVGAEFIRKNIHNVLESKPSADTMALGTDYCQLPGGKSGKYKSPKLVELYEKLFQTKFEEAHNSAADVNATAQIFFEMMRIGSIPSKVLLITEEQLSYFQETHTSPIQPFDIEIRQQVKDFHNESKKENIKTSAEINLGDYFNFHNHSIFSSLLSTSSISQLIEKAKENHFPAVGLVDLGNMMGAFKFISEVEKYNSEVKKKYQDYLEKKKQAEENNKTFNEPEPKEKKLIPILGCEFYLSDRPEQKQFTKDDPDKRTNIILLAKNFNGYKNLAKLSSIGFIKGFYFGVPRISKQMISEYKEDLIAISAGLEGDIPNAILHSGEKQGEEIFKWWKNEFGSDFYVQIQNHQLPEEEYVNKVLTQLAEKYQVKTLAQNETFYTEKSDAKIQDIIRCIKDGEKLSTPVGVGFGKRKSLQSSEFYIKNSDELKTTFRNYPHAFEAYSEFIQKFEPYTLKKDVLLPKFDIPKEFQDKKDLEDGGKRGENAYLRHLTYEGAKQRYKEITPEIRERLDFELDIIAKTGYPGYFLIVQDFCNEARKMDVWVGPGRGSAAGSAVAYCIGITNVDPIEYDLLFERFLNPERISMPDIDIDFEDEGRDKIIKWVIDKYGQLNVAQIITYSILGGKSAIKDAGRVLDISIPETNNIAKLVPSLPGMNIEKAFKKYDKLKDEEKALVDEMKNILDNPQDERFSVLDSAKKMEGCIRNTGIHACGVIITPEDISNLVPITTAAKDSQILVSQFDNSVAESAGLLKMDFLGLRTLTIIKDAIKIIEQRHGIHIDPDLIPLDDAKTYQLFKEGRTIGIFQYESPGMQKYMRELKPSVFADLIAMNALYRPGPIKYIPEFIKRKHGLEEIVYDLPETEEYLKETYGITVYQEQVMLLSQKLANFTKGEADTLRKAMGKKQIDVLNKMYPKFIERGKQNQLNEEKLNKIWKDWKAFAEYAFNKSHSTCYALIAYQTAYLKSNYPAEYMASIMSNNINNIAQITMYMEECKSIGVDVLCPDINESEYKFSVNEKGQIRCGLGAIKGIGEGPSQIIKEERKKGKFKDIYDFFERISAYQINKKTIENLVYAGAFDDFGYHRAQYVFVDASGKTTIEKLLQYGQSFNQNKNSVETSLFADFASEIQIERPTIPNCPTFQNMKMLNKEKEVIGFYLSAHPIDEYQYQYQFIKGDFDKNKILNTEQGNNLIEPQIDDKELNNEADEHSEDGELIDHDSKEIEPKGKFRFLNLADVEGYKSIAVENQKNTPSNWQDKNKKMTTYTVSGLITEFTVRDGYNSGEKVAFITVEDYSGTHSFRLGDRDYMRLKDKIDLYRFVVLKISFAVLKDGRCFLNVVDVSELSKALEKLTSISIIINQNELNRDDLEFLKSIASNRIGERELSFYIKNDEDKKPLNVASRKYKININNDLLNDLSNYKKFDFFLN